MIRKGTGIVLLIILLFAIWQYQLVSYGLAQARGQLHIIANTRTVEEVIEDAETPDSVREKLVFIQEVRRFAVDSFGINNSENYTTMYDQEGKPSLWVVTAAEQFALTPREWHFPLLGSFPYKGFFEYPMALKELEELKRDSLDTYISEVGGWSTLGFLKDPILSNMLSRNKGDLANLIIHELTHGTLFVKDSIEFNENLASFIGNEGAERFLKVKYGENSSEYLTYVNEKGDSNIFTEHILRGSDQLDSLYATFTTSDSYQSKMAKKQHLIAQILETVDTLSFYQPERFSNLKGRVTPNNAFFLSYIRYRAKLDSFEYDLKNNFNNNLKRYMTYLKEKYPSL